MPVSPANQPLARAAAFLALALLAILCVVSASDRLADQSKAVGPLGHLAVGPSQKLAIATSLLDQDPDEAASVAGQALGQAPLDVRALDVMGYAALRDQDAPRAEAVFRIAAQLGWRDAATQRYWFLNSLAAGAPDLAAQRLDALLRIGSITPTEAQFIDLLQASPAGRSAFVERMKLQPAWMPNYVKSITAKSGGPLMASIDTLALARSRGVPLSVSNMAAMSDAIADRRDFAAARAAWLIAIGTPPAAPQPLIRDGDFNHVRRCSQCAPFEWNLLSNGSVTTSIDTPPPPLSGTALRIEHAFGGTEDVAEQTLLLTPGAYVLRWRQTGGGRVDAGLVPSLRCLGGTARPKLTRMPTPDKSAAFSFSVMAAACPAQRLRLLVNGQLTAPLWADDIQIERLAS